MKIVIDKNPSKIRNLEALNQAESVFAKIEQGFFKSKIESEFRKFKEDSKIEDAKLIELHIAKENGKGEYKLNGNLSYNDRTKEIKFYVLSVYEFDNFRFNESTYIEFFNKTNSEEEDFKELNSIISKLRETKPKGTFNRNRNQNQNRNFDRNKSKDRNGGFKKSFNNSNRNSK